MSINPILLKLDKVLCKYFGFEKEEITPNTVEIGNNQVFISSSISFNRHSIKEKWEIFSKDGLAQLNSENKQKLGLALGKAIAEQLVISFDDTPIRKL